MNDLQLELQDVIAGFETRFRRIKRNGFKAFDSLPRDTTMDEEETEQDPESHQSPDVSILPIPEDESNSATPILGSEFPMVGRGKVEVEEALARGGGFADRENSREVGHSTDEETDKAQPLVPPTVVPPSSVSAIHAEL
jgi:hypothetical protein